jgi:hypothetical protein
LSRRVRPLAGPMINSAKPIITLTLDIDAETADGFPEDVESIVRDNAASLVLCLFGLLVFVSHGYHSPSASSRA